MDENFTRLSNEIVEALCRCRLGQHEWRVLMCIFRKTYGYHKKEDWIASSQVVEMTGIHKAHVSRALHLLKMRKMVTPRGNKIGFNKYQSQWNELPNGVTNHALKKVTPRGTKVTPRGISELPHGADTKETLTKETIQKKPSSTKKGPRPSVDRVMVVMKEMFGTLDDTDLKNRRYAWLLIQKAMKNRPGSSEEEASSAVVALARGTASHDFWGGKITKVENLYRNVQRIANDLRESSKPKVVNIP